MSCIPVRFQGTLKMSAATSIKRLVWYIDVKMPFLPLHGQEVHLFKEMSNTRIAVEKVVIKNGRVEVDLTSCTIYGWEDISKLSRYIDFAFESWDKEAAAVVEEESG